MISIERILCPANLPPESDEALGFAVSLARAHHARLFVCHCAGAPSFVLLPATRLDPWQVRKLLADSLSRYLGGASSAKLRWEVVVAESGRDTGEEIVRQASERRVDLIVMRSRRSSVVALLGSTAEQVSRTAPCPVLVVHPQERNRLGGSNGETGLRRVLVSHDFSSGSELALAYAISIAQKFRAELHLMHVLPGPEEVEPEVAWDETGVESAYHRAVRRLQGSVPGEVFQSCTVTHVVRWGKPYCEVLAYAREQDIDLVCMGAHGRDFGLEALFGSNVDRVLRQSPCPVLIARPLKLATPASFGLRIEAAH